MSKAYQPQDKFFKKAKDEGYRARSAFKLESIQKRFHIIKSGDRVLDLGAAPGSFMQLIQKIVGKSGLVIGIDLTPIKPFKQPNIKSYAGDIFDESVYEKILAENNLSEFDVITSDLAPATTGIKSVDAGRSLDLNLQVLEICKKHLKKGGHAVMKILPGFNEGDLIGEAKKQFKTVKKFRPDAVRKSSAESYIIGMKRIA